jgi:hypothetical protein
MLSLMGHVLVYMRMPFCFLLCQNMVRIEGSLFMLTPCIFLVCNLAWIGFLSHMLAHITYY